MPIPVNPDLYLAQVVFRPTINPLENSFVNTFFFLDEAAQTFAQVADDIEATLERFYEFDHLGAGGTPLLSYYSRVINMAATEVKIYDLGESAPRTPIIRGMASGVSLLDNSALPNEVSLVLSYRSGTGSPTGGTINRRARGRVYLGPFNVSALGFNLATDEDGEPVAGLVAIAAAAADDMRDTPTDITWMQYSRVADDASPVTGGFVDRAFDTQRRRGAEAQSRTVW